MTQMEFLTDDGRVITACRGTAVGRTQGDADDATVAASGRYGDRDRAAGRATGSEIGNIQKPEPRFVQPGPGFRQQQFSLV